MGKVIVANWVTLDGVMQGPGRPDEDTRDEFVRGGWAQGYADPLMAAKMNELMAGNYAWLFGRRTYQDLLKSWNRQGGPFKDALNNTQKYVASSRPAMVLKWPNSTLLHGNVPAAVSALKQTSDTNLMIMGSSVLIEALMSAGLIEQYLLMTVPLVLGSGRRLFPNRSEPTRLRLRDYTPTASGAMITLYETVR